MNRFRHARLSLAWLALASVAVCTPAMAAGFDITAGPSVTSAGRVTSAASASVFGEPPADGEMHFEPIGTLGWVDSRNTTWEDLNREVFLAAGGVRLVTGSRRWFLSEQIGATSTRTDALSSRFEFMTSAGWQRGHFIVMLRHVSNAHLLGHGKNLGETMLLAGIRW
ncbi:MAG: lipid A 3-O-deacylase [Rhodanobacteraceae bacterium]